MVVVPVFLQRVDEKHLYTLFGTLWSFRFSWFWAVWFPWLFWKKNVSESFIRKFEGIIPHAKGLNFIVHNISEIVIKIFFLKGCGRGGEGGWNIIRSERTFILKSYNRSIDRLTHIPRTWKLPIIFFSFAI